MIRQQQCVQEQQAILHGKPETDSCLDHLRQGNCRCFRSQRSSHNTQQPLTRAYTRCGRELHSRIQCPAKDATCHRCGKRGHYGSQCRTGRIEESNLETALLDAAGVQESESAWYTEIQFGSNNVIFILDTGTEVTAMLHETFQRLNNRP